MWPETVTAIKDVLAKRRQPKNPAHRPLLFLTKRRDSFAKENSHDNPIQKEFAKLVKPLKLKQLGRDRMATIQELADEAFADLLKKHGIPIDLKDALRKSAASGEPPAQKDARKKSSRKLR